MRFFSFLLMVVILCSFTSTQTENTFLTGFKSNDSSTISKSHKKIAGLSVSAERNAYLGGLEMKLAQFEESNGLKMKKFKSGKMKLENAILKKPTSVEFRFIRLVIQESTPKILKYNKQIISDANFIKKNYQTVSPVFKSAIIAHAKKSQKLNL